MLESLLAEFPAKFLPKSIKIAVLMIFRLFSHSIKITQLSFVLNSGKGMLLDEEFNVFLFVHIFLHKVFVLEAFVIQRLCVVLAKLVLDVRERLSL